jgi:hypothetical protein
MDFKNPDFLWATVDIAIWSDIEQGLAITAGSLATLRPLFRQISSHFGVSTGTPLEASKLTGRKTPQWKPQLQTNNRSLFPSFATLLRSEKGTVRDKEEEYGMGDLQHVRLRDDLVSREGDNEKNDQGFSSWAVQGSKRSDECREGTITVQTQIHRDTEPI